MFETYPKKSSAGKAGKTSGWKNGNGTSYPNTMPTKEDDHDKVVCHMQKGNGGKAAAYDYPDNGLTSDRMFGELNGLPS